MWSAQQQVLASSSGAERLAGNLSCIYQLHFQSNQNDALFEVEKFHNTHAPSRIPCPCPDNSYYIFHRNISTHSGKGVKTVGRVLDSNIHTKFLNPRMNFCVRNMYKTDMKRKVIIYERIFEAIKRNLKSKIIWETYIRFYKTSAVTILTYGSEIWTLTTEDKIRLESMEMSLTELYGSSSTEAK
jgi:hypothetical protein